MSIPKSYNIKSKKDKKRKFSPASCLFLSVIVTMVILLTAFLWFQNWYVNGINTPNSESGEIVNIEITQGMTTDQIGQLLLENDLISDKNLWDLYIKISGNGGSLLADKFELPKNLTMEQVVDTLQRPQEEKIIWVTFPEGIRYTTMAEILSGVEERFESDFTTEEFLRIAEFPDNIEFSEEVTEFLHTYKPKGVSLDGFLYPNTYAFEKDMTATDVVDFILKEFINQTSTLSLDNSEVKFYDALILASIVDAESYGDDDRYLIAGVFKNRLDDGMLLQSDATVNYVTGKKDRRATFDDLEVISPYNTYKTAGLPPTPINNPRIESIEASLNPIDTDYYFFLHAEDGTAYFGRTLEEHNLNISRYLDN